MMTRRALMTLLTGSGLAGFGVLGSAAALAQGVSSRAVKPTPRSKPSGLPFHARFTDVAREAGLTQPAIYGGVDSKRYIVEVVGCGVAFLDYDNDGWLDVLVLSGTRLEAAPAEATNRLYKNNRDGTFTDVTAKAGLTRAGWASSVTVGDFDNDGFDDLFITGYGYDALYRNNGDGTFTDVTAKAGLAPTATRYGGGCTWIDYDRDGRLDLLVARYLDTTLEQLPKPGESADCRWKGVPVNCGPRGLPTGFVQLFHNNGDGTFTDVSKASGVAAAAKSYPMTTVVADYDHDGWPDIYVACDSTPSWLFRNQRDGTFREEALERGVALSEDGLEQAGMGIATGDFDLDGNVDLFKTHFADDTNGLYRGDGKGFFDDVTIRTGIGVETRYVGWGAGMVDLDNDGLPDLFMVTGGVYPEVERTLPAYPFRTPRLVFRNLGNGRFEELIDEAGPGVAAVHASRGCAFGDFDNDGDVDVLVVEHERAAVAAAQRRLGHRPLAQGPAGRAATSNRSAIGARVAATLRRPDAGPGRDGAIELLFGQRSPAAFRTRRGGVRRSGDPLAERPDRAHRRRQGGPAGRDPRRRRHPSDAAVPLSGAPPRLVAAAAASAPAAATAVATAAVPASAAVPAVAASVRAAVAAILIAAVGRGMAAAAAAAVTIGLFPTAAPRVLRGRRRVAHDQVGDEGQSRQAGDPDRQGGLAGARRCHAGGRDDACQSHTASRRPPGRLGKQPHRRRVDAGETAGIAEADRGRRPDVRWRLGVEQPAVAGERPLVPVVELGACRRRRRGSVRGGAAPAARCGTGRPSRTACR